MEIIFIAGLCLAYLGGAMVYIHIVGWVDKRAERAYIRRIKRHNLKCEKYGVPHLKVSE